ncbi:hypothetical protein [uncultured Microscilla sp.]|uniref:hypothetical protein n=1 Tax=uncultured Microscilla sp. TaxID=432653 RepID=UPI0026362355|nr:hypothetical protein [uncultured Microscilla sp.]
MKKTKILKLFPQCIPYVKELRDLTGSINAAILMQQLDYYFICRPRGFYKFSQPSGHPEYRKGDSWVETLNFSFKEYKGAWQRIGITYASKTAYNQAEGDKFQGKLYCAYIDRKQNNKTYYFRNHALVDQSLEALPQSKELTIFRAMHSEQIAARREQLAPEHENHTCSMKITAQGEVVCSEEEACLLADLAADLDTDPDQAALPTNKKCSQKCSKESQPSGNTKNTLNNTTEETKEKEPKENNPPHHFSLSSSSGGGADHTGTQALNEAPESVSPGFDPPSASRQKIRAEFGQTVQPLIDQLLKEFDHLDLREERERLHKKLFERYEQYSYSVAFMTKQLRDYLKYHVASPFPIPKFQTADAFLDQGLNRDYATKLKKIASQTPSEGAGAQVARTAFEPLSPEQEAKLKQRAQHYEANKKNNASNDPK